MVRRVMFSFHYNVDSWRVSQVRNSQVISGANAALIPPQFLDKAKWEQVKRGGDAAIRAFINEAMRGTSVTVVLIGERTAYRRWVKYEIKKTIDDGKALLGVQIHHLRGQDKLMSRPGPNPFDQFSHLLDYTPPVYDWVFDSGRSNMADWIEEAIDRQKTGAFAKAILGMR